MNDEIFHFFNLFNPSAHLRNYRYKMLVDFMLFLICLASEIGFHPLI